MSNHEGESSDRGQGTQGRGALTPDEIVGVSCDTGKVLEDKHHTRADIRLLQRAMKDRWGVTEEGRGKIVAKLLEIVEEDEVDVTMMGPEGIETVKSKAVARGLQVRAASALITAVAQNQADEHLAEKNRRLDEGLATERVAMEETVIHVPVRPTGGGQ